MGFDALQAFSALKKEALIEYPTETGCKLRSFHEVWTCLAVASCSNGSAAAIIAAGQLLRLWEVCRDLQARPHTEMSEKGNDNSASERLPETAASSLLSSS